MCSCDAPTVFEQRERVARCPPANDVHVSAAAEWIAADRELARVCAELARLERERGRLVERRYRAMRACVDGGLACSR